MKELNTQEQKAFPESSPLNKADFKIFEAHIRERLSSFGVDDDDYCFIGSFPHKAVVRDVDVAILIDYDVLCTKFSAYDEGRVKFMPGFRQISFAMDFDNKSVQVDLMCVTSLEWAKFIYNPGIGSKYKGLYRNLLLQALLKTETHFQHNDGSYAEVVIRYSTGVYLVTKTRVSQKTGRVTKIPILLDSLFVTNDPTDFLRAFNLHNIDTFEQLFSQIRTRITFMQIVKNMVTYCEEIGLPIPDEINHVNN